MQYNRGEKIPAKIIPGMILYLEDAIDAINIGMRNQSNKDRAIGHIWREIEELKELL